MSRVVGPELLGRWSAGSGPLYRRLADTLRTAIARGDIPADSRLPAERALAAALNVSRSTVVSAYELLYAEGLVTRRQGSGTWVVPREASVARRSHVQQVWVSQAALRTIVDSPGHVIPFAASTMEQLPEGLPEEAFDLTAQDVLHRPPYYEMPQGLAELRATVAQLYRDRGLDTSPDQIVVTAGAQQAISLVASAHLSNGDLALLESPTYPGAIDALSLTGARLRGIPVTRSGAGIDSIERSVAQGHVGLIYLIPTFHNPTGTLMSEAQRARLATILDTWDVALIDDESLLWLSLGATPPQPMASFTRTAAVYSIGSMSKLFWGGMRIGWVRCPADRVGPIIRLKSISDLSCSVISQVVALNLLAHREHVMEMRRTQLRERIVLYRDLLAEHLPSWRFADPSGGVSLWVDIGRDADAFAQEALRHGVALMSGSAASVDARSSSFLRLPLGLDPHVIVEGIFRLRKAWREDRAAPVARESRLVV